MRVLVLGQGGREHALAWRLGKSPSVRRVYCAPGNPGTAEVATNIAVEVEDVSEILRVVQREQIELVVIGPEKPLVVGVADALRKQGVLVFGPNKQAAQLEGSKAFCKQLLRRAGIPTAEARIFDDLAAVKAYLDSRRGACVVKADGLAAGKGVIICPDEQAALAAATQMLARRAFGDAGKQILIEDFLNGVEVSVFAICDGRTLLVLPPCQDYKRIFDGDQGPNTGGMGAVCPSPRITDPQLNQVVEKILVPTLHALTMEEIPFCGVLYAGLMLTDSGPKVLEYNVRFGDPECQPLLLRLRSDLGTLLHAAASGALEQVGEIQWDERPAVNVVLAAAGYPGEIQTDRPIRGLADLPNESDRVVFQAGTKRDGDRLVTAGGRVLSVAALGSDFDDARRRAYEWVDRIEFTGKQRRTDIAQFVKPDDAS